MKRIKLLFSLWLVSFSLLKAQNNSENNSFISLNSFQPSDTNFSDLKQLDSYFENKTLIGLGESTHGTSEFTLMRHRIFKYLITNHQFNTFFLEADYGACQHINRYIHGKDDSLLVAIRKINLWPWMTKEMYELIEWMKEYNSENENKISFVGSDMQFINDDLLEIKKLIKGNASLEAKLDKINEIKSMDYIKDTAARKVNYYKWNELKKMIDTRKFTTDQKLTYEWNCIGIDLFFEFFNDTKIFSNFRVSCMAKNINDYMNLDSSIKGIYFAHNGHAQKWNIDRGKFGKEIKTGGFLHQLIGENYFCISLDFYSGKLLAYDPKGSALQNFESISTDKKSIGNYLNKFNQPILICPSKFIPDIEKKNIRSIGAVFEKTERQRNHYMYYGNLNYSVFDAIIFIRETTPTTYLFKK